MCFFCMSLLSVRLLHLFLSMTPHSKFLKPFTHLRDLGTLLGEGANS